LPKQYKKTWTVGLWMTTSSNKDQDLWIWNIVKNKHKGDYLWSVTVKAIDEYEALAEAERIFLTQYKAGESNKKQKECIAA
jgi:hypothetical protein